MRILMLFLALLLTWLPDGTPVPSPSLDRDWVCWENGVDMDEDEAILRTQQRLQERSGPALSPIHAASSLRKCVKSVWNPFLSVLKDSG